MKDGKAVHRNSALGAASIKSASSLPQKQGALVASTLGG